MRVLQICPRVPWPPHDGGRVAMLQLTRGLIAAGATVDVAALNQRKFWVDPSQATAALAPAGLHTVDIDTSRYFRALLRRAPLLVARFYVLEFEQLLRRLAPDYDVIQLEGQFLLPYVPAIRAVTRAPVVLRAQNVEFRIWERLGTRSFGARAIARSLRRWETAHLNDCDALLPIAEEDARDFRALGAAKPALVVPCGVEVAATALETDPYRVYFVGSMQYRPNQEAVRWLADEVWPRVMARARAPRPPMAGYKPTLLCAGSGFPAALRADLESRGIEVAADVPDLAAFAAPFRTMLAPLFSGSGMRIKVLEAMAQGKAVIATTLGAGGIDVTPGENILIADDADAFAEHVIRCMEDDALAQRIGAAARTLATTRYDSNALARQLLAFYEELLRKAS
jgi:glycosyltransferase involved in cell wall biosynthesis